MGSIEELFIYLLASKMRFNVMKTLETKFIRPGEIAKITGYHTNNVSMILNQTEVVPTATSACTSLPRSSGKHPRITRIGPLFSEPLQSPQR